MAIAWLLATPDTQFDANAGGISTTLTATKAALTGLANGHVWVVFIALSEGGIDQAITKPDGFELVQRSDRANVVAGALYRRVITDVASEPASYTWTVAGGSSWGMFSNALTGVDVSDDPVDVSAVANQGAGGGLVAPTVDPVTSNGFLTCFWSIDQNASTSPVEPITAPDGMTSHAQIVSGSNTNDTVAYVAHEQLASGDATGTRTATPANSAANAAISVVWKTAAGGGPAPVTLSVTVSGTSGASSGVRSPHRMSVTVTGASAVSAAITAPGVVTFSLTVSGVSSAGVGLRAPYRLAPTSAGTSSVTLSLSVSRIARRGRGSSAVRALASGRIQIRPMRGAASMSTQHGTRWDINDKPRLQYTVTDEDGALVDPATVSLRVVKPDESSDDYSSAGTTVARAAQGIYYVEPTLDQSGTWYFRWETTLPDTAEEGSFVVRRNKVARIN